MAVRVGDVGRTPAAIATVIGNWFEQYLSGPLSRAKRCLLGVGRVERAEGEQAIMRPV